MRLWLLFLPRNPDKPVGPAESSFQSEWKAQCKLYTHLRYKNTHSTPKLSIDKQRPLQKNCLRFRISLLSSWDAYVGWVTWTRCSTRYLIIERLLLKEEIPFRSYGASVEMSLASRHHDERCFFLKVKRCSTHINTCWGFSFRSVVMFLNARNASCVDGWDSPAGAEEEVRDSFRSGCRRLSSGLSGAVVLNSSTVLSQNCEMFRTTSSGRHWHWLRAKMTW